MPAVHAQLADFAVVDAELGDRVRFVGVNPWDTAEKMVSFAADRGVTYELLRDDRGAFAEALDIVAYPATLFVGADGTILRRHRAHQRRRPAPAHHGAVVVNVGLSFLRGMVATVNPCGFVLLPTYLMYFLGIEATRSDSERATVRRALLVGAAVTAGFMVVFVLVGGVTKWSTDWVLANAKYVTGIAGLAFVVLGIAMLFGFKLRITTPALAVGERDTTVRSMFVYGIVYTTVSLSCTLALFAPLLFERGSVGAGVVNGAAFALGMGLLVTALTVALAVANHALLGVLRTAMQHIQALAGAFVLLSGLYLLYYFWVVDVQGESGPLNEAVENFQNRITNVLNDNWQLVAGILVAIVLAAVLYVGVRRRPGGGGSVGSPVREPSS